MSEKKKKKRSKKRRRKKKETNNQKTIKQNKAKRENLDVTPVGQSDSCVTTLHSSDEGSKTPLVKKFTYFIFEPWIKKKSRKKMEMRLYTGWKWGYVCFHEFHLILGSITTSLFLGIWFGPPQPIEKRAGRADLRKSIFEQSDRCLPIKSKSINPNSRLMQTWAYSCL